MGYSLQAHMARLAWLWAASVLQELHGISPEKATSLLAEGLDVSGKPRGDSTPVMRLLSTQTRGDALVDLASILRPGLGAGSIGDWLNEGLARLSGHSAPLLIAGLGRFMLLPPTWAPGGEDDSVNWTSLDADQALVELIRLTLAVGYDDLPDIRRRVRTWVTSPAGEVDWPASLGDVTYGTIMTSAGLPGLGNLLKRGWLAPGGRLVLLWLDEQDIDRDALDILDLEAVAHLPLQEAERSAPGATVGIAVFRMPGDGPTPEDSVFLPRSLPGDPPTCEEIMHCLASSLTAGDQAPSSLARLAIRVPHSRLSASWEPRYYERLEWLDQLRLAPGAVRLGDVAEILEVSAEPYAGRNDELTLVVPNASLDNIRVGEAVSFERDETGRFAVESRSGERLGQVREWEAEHLLGDWFEQPSVGKYDARVVQALPLSTYSSKGTLVLQCTHPRYGDDVELVEVVETADIAANSLQLRRPNRVCAEAAAHAPRLQPGDLLLPAWRAADACIIPSLEHPSLAGSGMDVIRPHADADPEWLLGYVLGPDFQAQCEWPRSPGYSDREGPLASFMMQPLPRGWQQRVGQALADLRQSYSEGSRPLPDPILTEPAAEQAIPAWVYGSMLSPLFCDWSMLNSLGDWGVLKAKWVSEMREALVGSPVPVVEQIVNVLAELERLDGLIESERLLNHHRNGDRPDLEERFGALAQGIRGVEHPPLRHALQALHDHLRNALWLGEGGGDWEEL